MAYTGNITDLPIGSLGLVKRDNRLQHLPGELIIANGLTLEDNSLRKEMGASLYDPAGVSGAPSYSGTMSAADAYGVCFAVFTGSAIAAGGTAVAQAWTSGTTRTVAVPVGGYAIGTLVVVGYIINGAVGASTVTDARGNVYTATSAEFDTGAGPVMRLFYSKLTTGLLAADLITVNFNGISGLGEIVVANFTGLNGTLDRHREDHGSGTTVLTNPVGSISTVPYLCVALVGNSVGDTHAPAVSYIEAIEGTRGAGAEDAALHYRIDTSSPTIIAMYDWQSLVQTTPAGTVTTVSGSAAVVGVATTFTNHAPGDRIIVNGESRTISTITDATHLTTTDAWTVSNAGVAYDRRVGNRLITATTGGNLFKDKPATLSTTNLDDTTLASGLSLSARPGRFVAAGKEAAANTRKLFYFNGVNRVQVLAGDGVTTTNLASAPADWDTATNPLKQPINGVVHNNRLVGWGNLNDPHRLYFSDVDNHENFAAGTSFNMRVRSDIGDRIFCGVDYQGILLVWKYPKGIFYLDDTDLTTSNWSIRTKSESLGCAPSPYAVLPIDDDVLFMAPDGSFHMLSAVDSFGGVKASNLSYALGFANYLRDNLNLARLDLVTSCWYPQKKIALFAVPGVGSTTPNLTLKFDFSGVNAGKPVLFHVSDRDAPDALAMRQSATDTISRPIFAEGGFVWLTEQAARNKNSVAYTGTFQTAHEDYTFLDPKLRYKRKLWEHLELVMEPVGAGTITVVVYVDGVARQTLTFDATKRRQRKKLNVGDGYTLSISASESTLNGDMNVIGVGAWFTVGDEDQSR